MTLAVVVTDVTKDLPLGVLLCLRDQRRWRHLRLIGQIRHLNCEHHVLVRCQCDVIHTFVADGLDSKLE